MRLLAASVIGLLAGASASAGEPMRSLRNVGVLTGSCDRLVGFGRDLGAECDNRVANVEWSDGRDSFTFTFGGGDALTFSGAGQGEIRQGPDVVVQPLDVVFATLHGKSQSIGAVGGCRFSNPNRGGAAIACDAQTAQGLFSAAFTTDGHPGHVIRFAGALPAAR